MLKTSKILQEKKDKLEMIKIENTHNFYKLKLKLKVFKILEEFLEINKKIKAYYLFSIINKKRKKLAKLLMNILRRNIDASRQTEMEYSRKLNYSKKVFSN